MFRVAICDDEQAICGEIEKILLDYSKERRLKIDVEIFSSGEKLCQALENGEMYYLLFLDIMVAAHNRDNQRPTVMVTHSRNIARKYADTIVELDRILDGKKGGEKQSQPKSGKEANHE